jgi:SAM-dependent methyltransferase
MAIPMTIQEQFGQIDIYVFDQILRGNITGGMRVLDAGCGYGRNLVHLLREGCEVFALDADANAVEHVRQLSASLGRDREDTVRAWAGGCGDLQLGAALRAR